MKRWLAIAFLSGGLLSALLRISEANARAEAAEAWAATVEDEVGMLMAEIWNGKRGQND